MSKKLKPFLPSIYVYAIIVCGLALYALLSLTTIPFKSEFLGISFTHDRQWEAKLHDEDDIKAVAVWKEVDGDFITLEVLDNPSNVSAEQLADEWVKHWISLSPSNVEGWVEVSNRQSFDHELGDGFQFDAVFPFFIPSGFPSISKSGKLAIVKTDEQYIRVVLGTSTMRLRSVNEFWKVVDSLEVIE